MKIAVTYENGQVFQHFGHTESFKIYTEEGGRIVSAEVTGTDGNGHESLAGFLKSAGVEALICGGIGAGARKALEEAGIAFYPGVSGAADEAVRAFLNGTLEYRADAACAGHHGHEEGNCGHGQGSCGRGER